MEYVTDLGRDKHGNVIRFADAQAREDIAKMKPEAWPVGVRVISGEPIEPHELYGGIWEFKAYHNFNADYVYEKTGFGVEGEVVE